MAWTTLAVRLAQSLALALALAVPAAPAGAQSDSAAVLSDVVMQSRVNRVLDRLDDLFTEDRKAAEGAPVSEASAVALRREIQRLALRARTAGLSLDAVADALRLEATARFGSTIPGAFATGGGELDARALIRGIVGETRAEGPARAENSYLSAISEEGSHTSIGRGRTDATEPAAPDMARAAATPAPEAPAAELDSMSERAEREGTRSRMVTVDGKRYLVVQSGDTLGSIARNVYGDILLYRRIYEANREKLSNPNVITLGTRLVIP
jgi:nucleoid-associated protein YgaU